MLKIYGDDVSGDFLKLRWLMDHLDVDYQWIVARACGGAASTAAGRWIGHAEATFVIR